VSGIEPIKRATASQDNLERPGRYATIAGWGNTIKQPANCENFCNTDSNYPKRMREARVPLVSDAEADKTYDAINGPSGYIPPLMVAAGREGKDTCQGDSGGPLFAKTASGPRQIGITSFGAGCATKRYPGVYTEVNAASIRSFITDAARR
jgi:secreted trypsin-like serine protease